MFILASPDWKGSAPIAISRESPIDIVIEPITIAAIFNCLWMPVSRGILSKQSILDLGSSDIPRRLRVIDKRSVASPAMRIGVFILLVLIK